MASPTQWTWIWVDSGNWWWTGRPGMLRFMGSQRGGHNWATELNWKYQLNFKRMGGGSHFLVIQDPENILHISLFQEITWKYTPGNYLAVQWSGLCMFTSKGAGSIPSQGTKIPKPCGFRKRLPLEREQRLREGWTSFCRPWVSSWKATRWDLSFRKNILS